MLKKCSVCQNNSYNTLYSTNAHPFFEGIKTKPIPQIYLFPLIVKQCQNCGFVFIESSTDAYRKIDNFYHSTNSMTSAPMDKSNHTSKVSRQFVDFLLQDTTINSETKVLEIGCREGSILSYLRKKFNADVTGVDVSGTPPIQDELGPLNIIKDYFPSKKINEKFNLIYTKAVLEHIKDPAEFINGVYKLLTPDGIFIAQVPKVEESLVNGNIGIFIYEHFNYFTKSTLIKLCQNNNLFVTKIVEDHASLTIICQKEPSSKKYSITTNLYDPQKFTDSIELFKKNLTTKDISFFGASPDLYNYLYTTLKNTSTNYQIYDNDSYKINSYFGRNKSPIKSPSNINNSPIAIMPFNYISEITKQLKKTNKNIEIINIW